MDPKLLKVVAKIGVGVLGSFLLGTTYKAEKNVKIRIDNYFDSQMSATPKS